jgi:hypothetical protein
MIASGAQQAGQSVVMARATQAVTLPADLRGGRLVCVLLSPFGGNSGILIRQHGEVIQNAL